MILGVSILASSQVASYEAEEITINVGGHIDYCEITLKMAVEPDGVYQYFQVPPIKRKGSTLTLLLIDYQEYTIIVKDGRNVKEIVLSTNGSEIIDDRDLYIKANVDYAFKHGILVFNYNKQI